VDLPGLEGNIDIGKGMHPAKMLADPRKGQQAR